MRVTSTILDDARHVARRHGETLEPLAGSTLLVTGASGFLMSYVLDVVAAANDLRGGEHCRMIAVDNLSSGLPDRVAHLVKRQDVRFLEHDVVQPLDPGRGGRLDRARGDDGLADLLPRFPLETIDVNVTGTRWLLELARAQDVSGMIYMSSSEIYGDPEPSAIPTAEDYRGIVSCTGPRACYDESKRIGETLATIYHRRYGTRVTSIGPSTCSGPGSGWTTGGWSRPPVRRARWPPARAAERRQPHEVVLLRATPPPGSSGPRRGREGGRLQRRQRPRGLHGRAGRDGRRRRRPARPGDPVPREPRPRVPHRQPQPAMPDLTRLRGVAGWSPEVDLATGLRRTLVSHREALDGEPTRTLGRDQGRAAGRPPPGRCRHESRRRGTGYVGLVTGACLAERGHTVTCVDVDPERVATLSAGRVPFHEPGLAEIVARVLAAGRLRVTGDLASAVAGPS